MNYMGIQTDTMYSNSMSPEENEGYATKYRG